MSQNFSLICHFSLYDLLLSMVYQELPCIKLVGLHFLHIKHNCHVEVRVIKLIKFDMINNFQSCGPLTSAHGWQLNEINQTSYSTVHNIDRCLCNPNWQSQIKWENYYFKLLSKCTLGELGLQAEKNNEKCFQVPKYL